MVVNRLIVIAFLCCPLSYMGKMSDTFAYCPKLVFNCLKKVNSSGAALEQNVPTLVLNKIISLNLIKSKFPLYLLILTSLTAFKKLGCLCKLSRLEVFIVLLYNVVSTFSESVLFPKPPIRLNET